jgi:hypothetical protein
MTDEESNSPAIMRCEHCARETRLPARLIPKPVDLNAFAEIVLEIFVEELTKDAEKPERIGMRGVWHRELIREERMFKKLLAKKYGIAPQRVSTAFAQARARLDRVKKLSLLAYRDGIDKAPIV